MKSIFSCSLCFIIVYFLNTNNLVYGDIRDDYCWRDYNGIAPSDALKGGTDRAGRPIFIGQTLFDKKLIPGKLYENATGIHIEFQDVYFLTEAVKILCTSRREKFEWIKTKHDEVLDMKDKHFLFEGGYEKGVTTYIGRAISHGEMTVGKVMCWVDRCIRLTTVEDGKWTDHDEFEILTYNGAIYDDEPAPTAASIVMEDDDEGTYYFLFYSALVVITGLLITVVVLIVRRC